MMQARAKTPDKNVRSLRMAAAILIAAILLGGGGVAYGINNALVQLLALIALAASFPSAIVFWNSAPIAFRILCVATLAYPLAQLLPLPPWIWQQLPARELVTQSLEAAGIEPGWRALTLDSARTLVAVLSLLVPLTVALLTLNLRRAQLQFLGWTIVGLGLANFLWGIPQVLSQGASAIPYPENPMPGVLFGSFANRNSTAIFLVICLTMALQLHVPKAFSQWSALFRSVIALVLSLAVLLTQSRSGMALLAVPYGLLILRMIWGNQENLPGRKLVVAATLATTAIASAGLLVAPDSRIGTSLERFSGDDGHRAEMREDAAFAAARYWPVGSGAGTFDEVFQVDESLEHISPRTAGRAHNDYLELAIEGGAISLLLLVAWASWLMRRTWMARLSPDRWIAWSGTATLLAIALQSLVDYPLRNLALLAVAAFAAVISARFSSPRREETV